MHQGVGEEFGRHHRATGFAHELDVVQVRGTIGPLVRAGEGGVAGFGAEGKGIRDFAGPEVLIDPLELGGLYGPIVERGLQRGCDLRHFHGRFQRLIDNDQGSVTAVFETR
jgi:hypothetical protein